MRSFGPAPQTSVVIDPGALAADAVLGGTILRIGTGTTVAGLQYYLKTDFSWALTNAGATATAGGVVVGIAMGTNPAVDGMYIGSGLLNADTALDANYSGIVGTVWMDTVNGQMTFDKPVVAGNQQRIMGWGINALKLMVYSPSPTWIQAV